MSLTDLSEIKDKETIIKEDKRAIMSPQKGVDKSEDYFGLKSMHNELNSQLNGNPSYNEVD